MRIEHQLPRRNIGDSGFHPDTIDLLNKHQEVIGIIQYLRDEEYSKPGFHPDTIELLKQNKQVLNIIKTLQFKGDLNTSDLTCQYQCQCQCQSNTTVNRKPIPVVTTSDTLSKVTTECSKAHTADSSRNIALDDLESRKERLRQIIQQRNAENKAKNAEIKSAQKHERIVRQLVEVAKSRP